MADRQRCTQQWAQNHCRPDECARPSAHLAAAREYRLDQTRFDVIHVGIPRLALGTPDVHNRVLLFSLVIGRLPQSNKFPQPHPFGTNTRMFELVAQRVAGSGDHPKNHGSIEAVERRLLPVERSVVSNGSKPSRPLCPVHDSGKCSNGGSLQVRGSHAAVPSTVIPAVACWNSNRDHYCQQRFSNRYRVTDCVKAD